MKKLIVFLIVLATLSCNNSKNKSSSNLESEEYVDIIGVFDSITVSDGWDIGGTTNATENHTLIRNPSICNGNMGDWNI